MLFMEKIQNDSFKNVPINIVDKDNKTTLNICVKSNKKTNYKNKLSRQTNSKSWDNGIDHNRVKKFSTNSPDNSCYYNFGKKDRPYDAISNCKSAGIIPYTIHNQNLYFLFQKAENPKRKKDSGWNDFGGKKIEFEEHTALTAAREFSEETSCLFYLLEIIENDPQKKQLYLKYYEMLKNNDMLKYDKDVVEILKQLIKDSQNFFFEKITEVVLPIYISSKETYISYFVKVKHIPEQDLPIAEDIHIPYDVRYIRQCKWISYDELLTIDNTDFHKRLQITRIQQRIIDYKKKGLFS